METKTDQQSKQDVIFFFGAGASVDAGIPDTYTFAIEFEEYIKKEYTTLADTLDNIIRRRKQFNRNNSLDERVDVEQLLDTLRRLANREKEPLLEFYDEKKPCQGMDIVNCINLKEILENFIREKVIVKEIGKLEYLRDLLKFDFPLEIYSTNYDTCIEQLSYLTHSRYTDGFNIDWNEKNFNENYDIKHYKLHGSVIWFENVQTKQTVKIPAQAFYNKQPVELKLIYGEDIKPLLLYPAQKIEYTEPLTDLQLMFKHRLFDPTTRFVIFVGYSFKDEYVARMLWDAARANENLYVFIISPEAQNIYEDKIRYVNKDKKDPSRIDKRVICLPYTFETVIPYIKNHYINGLRKILDKQKEIIEEEKKWHNVNADWQELLRGCIEIEYLFYAEQILNEKFKQLNWENLKFDTIDYGIYLSSKAFFHSLVAKDGLIEKWLERLNSSLSIFNLDRLNIHANDKDFYLFFEYAGTQFRVHEVQSAIIQLFDNYNTTVNLLGHKFAYKLEPIDKSIDRLSGFINYSTDNNTRLTWESYRSSIEDNERNALDQILARIPSRQPQNFKNIETPEKARDRITVEIEKKRIEKMFGGKTPTIKIE